MNMLQVSSVSTAGNDMTIVEVRVHMDCPGCESRVKKALQKLKGVDSVEIDMGMQKVTVTGWVKEKKVLKAVRRTGRIAELWPYPYSHEANGFTEQYYKPKFRYNETQSYSSSLYSYYKHGYYDGYDHGYPLQPPFATIIDPQASSLFSDENPNACSVM